MSKLDEMLPKLYQELHDNKAFKGDSWERWYETFLDLFENGTSVHRELILDFGCGPTGGLCDSYLGQKPHSCVIGYDPYVPVYSADPWDKKITVVFSCDVLEHMPLTAVVEFLRKLVATKTIKKVMLVIATRAASKTMSNGLNAHITVRSPDWWHAFIFGTIGEHFEIEEAKADLIQNDVLIVLRRKDKNET